MAYIQFSSVEEANIAIQNTDGKYLGPAKIIV